MSKIIRFSYLCHHPVHLLSFGLGSGLIRPAPGTWGTLAGLCLYALFAALFHPGEAIKIILLILFFLLGIYLCGQTEKMMGESDFSGIVWDEFVGIWCVLAWMPKLDIMGSGLLGQYLIAFCLFRLFDILKPFPIRLLDRRIHGGFGIMLDDVLAAFYALVVFYLIAYLI